MANLLDDIQCPHRLDEYEFLLVGQHFLRKNIHELVLTSFVIPSKSRLTFMDGFRDGSPQFRLGNLRVGELHFCPLCTALDQASSLSR